MKFVALVCLLVFLSSDVKSIPVQQDVRREDMLAKCLVQILSKVLYKADAPPLNPECNNILKTGPFPDVKKAEDVTVERAHEGGKRPRGESKVKEEVIEDILKTDEDKREEHEERSQEEFPSFIKRKIRGNAEEFEDERSQEEFPSFLKRWIRGNLDEQEDERSQEEFPSFMKRRIREKLDEPEDERSQEDFPNIFRRSSGDTEDERSQEEFPQKRHYTIFRQQKRDDRYPDEERSQEEFPSYQYKRSHLTAKDKREDPDYDRSQEDFPSYVNKRNHEEEDDEEEDREKRIWKPSHRYHHKKKHHKRSEDEEDYDRSQEDFPTYLYKRNKGTSQDEVSEEVNEEKRYWKPTHRYHHKKKLHHKRADSVEDEEEPIAAVLRSYKHRSPEEEEEDIIQGMREEKHPFNGHEEGAEETQEREDVLKYLTKKKVLGERLSNGDDKRSPWMNRGFYHPAWYKRNLERDHRPYDKLEELTENLRYKRELVSQETHDQKLLKPDELKELEKLASEDQQMKENQP